MGITHLSPLGLGEVGVAVGMRAMSTDESIHLHHGYLPRHAATLDVRGASVELCFWNRWTRKCSVDWL